MRNIFLAVVVLALSACAAAPIKKIDQSKVDQFVRGKTTYAEVVHQLGAPTSVSNKDGVKTAHYDFREIHVSAFTYIPIAGALAPNATVGGSVTTFEFNKASVLTSIQSNDNSADGQ